MMLNKGEILEKRYVINSFNGDLNCEKYVAYDEVANEEVDIILVEKSFREIGETTALMNILMNMNYACLQKYRQFVIYKNSIYAVLEKVYGKTISEIITKQKVVKSNRIKKWYSQLSGALDYITKSGYKSIHGDITPTNIVIDENDNANLLWSKININDSCILFSSLSMPYSSPEQYIKYTDFCNGGEYKKTKLDIRSDIYSLGKVFYELVTFSKPQNPYEIQTMLSQWNVDCDPGIVRIIDKSMQYDPADRYKSIKDLLKDIDAACQTTQNNSKGLFKRFETRKISLIALTLAIAVCVVGIVICIYIYKNDDSNKYEEYIKKAEQSAKNPTTDEAIENYKKAIEFNPKKSIAYNDILDKVILKDSFLDYDENVIVQTLFTEGRMEKLKASNEEAYYEIIYKLANAYMFFYDNEIVGSQKAYVYYNKLLDAKGVLTEREMNRVEFFTQIYYQDYKNKFDSENTISYKEFWDRLNSTMKNIDIEGDCFLSAKICEAVYQYIVKYEKEFISEGITYEEMLEVLENINSYVEQLKAKENTIGALPSNINLKSDLANLEYVTRQFYAFKEVPIEESLNYESICFNYDIGGSTMSMIGCNYLESVNQNMELYIMDVFSLYDYKVILINGMNQMTILEEGKEFTCELVDDNSYIEKLERYGYKYKVTIYPNAFQSVGQYTIIVAGYDTYSDKMYGNLAPYIENTRAKYTMISSDNLTFIIDNDKPEIVIPEVENGKTYNKDLKINISYADTDEISEIEITTTGNGNQINNKKYTTLDNLGTNGSVNYEIGSYKGKQNLTVKVTDVAGNTRVVDLQFTVDSKNENSFISNPIFLLCLIGVTIIAIAIVLHRVYKAIKR